jgi:hypothetical protein
MQCPYFKQMHDVGACSASKHSFIPGINKMGHFCFQDAFRECTFFKNSLSEEGCKGQWHVMPEKHILSAGTYANIEIDL